MTVNQGSVAIRPHDLGQKTLHVQISQVKDLGKTKDLNCGN